MDHTHRYRLFMSEGVVSALSLRQLEGPERARAIQGHALLQLRSLVCITLGFCVIYRNKVSGSYTCSCSAHCLI